MRRFVPAFLVLATILTYLPVLQNGFVYDDHFQLERNPYIREFRHLDILLTKEVWYFSPGTKSNNYRPLHMISYLFIYKIFGFNPAAFHLVLLILYVISVLLLWKIYTYYVQAFPAFLGGLLFAMHPVHVESVAWIGGIPDLLCAIFLFLSFLFYLHNKNILSLVSFFFALFSKETSLVFPLIIAADHLLFRKQEKRRVYFWCAGAVVLILSYAILRVYSLGNFMRITDLTIGLAAMVHASVAFAGLYLGKMLFPIPLNAFYHFSLPLSLAVSWAGIVLFFAALILVYAFRRNRLFLMGCIWCGVFLLPAFLLTGVSPVLFAERYLFLPSAGFVLALISFPLKRYVPTFLILISILFAGISFSRSKVWRNDLTLWVDTVEKSPDSPTVNFNLATAYLKQKDLQRAAIYYSRTLALDPRHADSYYNLALCEYNLGNKKSAADNLRKFLQYSAPNHPMRKDAELKLQKLSVQ